MNKAFVLTRCSDVGETEKQLINNSNIFKIAVNNANYKSNVRIFHDYSYYKYFIDNFTEPLITSYHAKQSCEYANIKQHLNRFILFYNCTRTPNSPKKSELYFETGTIIPAIDYCIKNGFTEILLVADNKAHSQWFQTRINNHLKNLQEHCNLYQFKLGNFKVSVKSIQQFIEEKTNE